MKALLALWLFSLILSEAFILQCDFWINVNNCYAIYTGTGDRGPSLGFGQGSAKARVLESVMAYKKLGACAVAVQTESGEYGLAANSAELQVFASRTEWIDECRRLANEFNGNLHPVSRFDDGFIRKAQISIVILAIPFPFLALRMPRRSLSRTAQS